MGSSALLRMREAHSGLVCVLLESLVLSVSVEGCHEVSNACQ